jgi:hypothetical protein
VPKPKVNYAWDAEGLEGWITEVTDPVDGVEIFATFTEARQALGDWYDQVAKDFDTRRYWARRMLKSDLANGKADIASVVRRYYPGGQQ